jgi:hypothetical protein
VTLIKEEYSEVLEMKSVVVQFQGKAFNPGCWLAYQRVGAGSEATDKGT